MTDATYTRDWKDEDFDALIEICAELSTPEGTCRPSDVLRVAWVESGKADEQKRSLGGCWADAKNPRSSATGLIQWMSDHYTRWGYKRDEFAALGISGQLPYLRQFFAPHRGKLTSPARVYTAVFLPAYVDQAGDLDYVLAERGGRLDWAYRANTFFDRNKDGRIQVRELEQSIEEEIEKARTWPKAWLRWVELGVRLAQVRAMRTVDRCVGDAVDAVRRIV